MKHAATALLLILVTIDTAAALMPDRWKSERTPEAERGLRECVMSHQDDWGYACALEAAVFIDVCQKHEGLSEQMCKEVRKRDIMTYTLLRSR
jgi:hypothetical protein